MTRGDGVSGDAPGKAFEVLVADAYRALGYQVTANVQLPGKQTDLLVRREVDGAPPIVQAIECKDHARAVSNTDVNEFINRVLVQRAGNLISSGVMVSANGFTADGRAAGEIHPCVQLLSWDELISQILDVRHQLKEMTERYEASAIYQHYVPLNVEPWSWSTLAPDARAAMDLEDVLKRWRGDGEPGRDSGASLFVLADFGAGKTTLLEHIQYDRAKAYLAGDDSRVPLMVSLRDFREVGDMTALLCASFRDTYYRDMSSDLLWSRIESGRFYVLLDAFDEMVERSDADRRTDLFYALLDVLRSKSPTVVTSRPGYFVGRSELDDLLTTLGRREREVSRRSDALRAAPRGDSLRRDLVRKHRETPVWRRSDKALDEHSVEVVALMALDETLVESFVRRHDEELRAAGTTPEAVLAFIDRTYDLNDLSSRPILLELILSSVLLGKLDLDDTDTQYGPSGLYEIYTHAKLDLDLAKGRTRTDGLSLDLRRRFAEEVAVAMYAQGVLEIDFQAVLDQLMEDDAIKADFAAGGMSDEEIATDLATCSFITLDGEGGMRFIHKSFRGFFVARVLKENLRHPLMSERLEQEVLYFLGGFAPTQPRVGEELWAAFLRADAVGDRRRNLLAAYLYTRPDHDSRRISDGEIAGTEFGRLSFTKGRMANSRWSSCTVAELMLDEPDWRDVRLVGSHVGLLEVDGGRVEANLQGSSVERCDLREVTCQVTLDDSDIQECEIERTRLLAKGMGGSIDRLRATRGVLTLGSLRGRLDWVEVRESDLRLPFPTSVRAERSVIACPAAPWAVGDWDIEDSLVVLSDERPADVYEFRAPASLDPVARNSGSVILSQASFTLYHLGDLECGVFGSLRSADEGPVIRVPHAWGVLEATEALTPLKRLRPPEGGRFGGVLLVEGTWYEREVAPDGQLSAVHELAELAAEAPVTVADLAERTARLVDLLEQARAQFEAVMDDRDWPELARIQRGGRLGLRGR